jgi:hypothetical protein
MRSQDPTWVNESSQVVKSYAAYDGMPAVELLTGGFVRFMDLAIPQKFGRMYDWVMSISVGENIPKQFEGAYVANIVQPAREGVVISWGYKTNENVTFVNEKHQRDVVSMITMHGFVLDLDLSAMLRLHSKLPWMRTSLLVFRRATSALSYG